MENCGGRPSSNTSHRPSSLVEENYPASLCYRSLFTRPLPSGKQVYFVLLQVIFFNIAEGITEVFLQYFLIKYCGYTGPSSMPTVISFELFPLLLCLPMGFIADRYFGRAKVLYYSWISLFIAQLMITLYFLIYFIVPDGKLLYIFGIIICAIGLLVNAIGLAGIRVNLIPFGVDQMRVASSDQLSSYFHWYYLSRNIGLFFAFTIGASLMSSHVIFSLFIAFSATAAGTIIILLGYEGFIKSDKTCDPLLLIFGVLKNAATVKRPNDRTAFSYDGRPEPSRIDLAKETHYGNFPDEKVEDVKTFLRILMLLVSLFGFLIVNTVQSNAYTEQSAFLHHPKVYSNHNSVEHLTCNNSSNFTEFRIHHFSKLFSLNWILTINIVTVLLVIPMLDRVVYPLCCPWMPSMFSRIGAGMLFNFISIFCAIVVEAIRYHTFEHSSTSVIRINEFQYFKVFSVSMSVGTMAPQLCAQAIAECLTLVTMVEFIYAQSPSYMKGLLLGCLFFIEGCALTLATLLFVTQSKGDTAYWEYYKTISNNDLCEAAKERETGSSLAAYTVIAIVTLLCIALFWYSAKKYKLRVRDRALRYYLIT